MAYHNDLHGSDVALQVSHLLNQRGMNGIGLNNYDVLSLLVAALAHDVGHDGYSNQFHVSQKTCRYQTYGDYSVQEGYHAATTVLLMEKAENDFLGPHLTRTAKRLIKKRILCSILDTDIAKAKNNLI